MDMKAKVVQWKRATGLLRQAGREPLEEVRYTFIEVFDVGEEVRLRGLRRRRK